MTGRFKQTWTGDDVMFGTWFDGPLKLPYGYSAGIAFARAIDPSMTYSLAGDKPYMFSPLICAMNVVHLEPAHGPGAVQSEAEGDQHQTHRANGWRGVKPGSTTESAKLALPEWKYYGGRRLEENVLQSWEHWPDPPTASFYSTHTAAPDPRDAALHTDESRSARERRRWFLDEQRRRAFKFHPDAVYSWDFFSPYVDVNKMRLKFETRFGTLPINMTHYLNGQPLKYQARTRDGKVVFFEFVVGLA
jgi:hypothetical protein